MSHQKKTFIFGDIHGEFDKFMALIDILKREEGLSCEAGDSLVSLGDKNDRGPNTRRVMDAWLYWQKMWGNQVTCLLGNHEAFFLRAIIEGPLPSRMSEPSQWDILMWNGGNQTHLSYTLYGDDAFRDEVAKAGHVDFMKAHDLWHETEQAFFSHAPLPNPKTRRKDWEKDEQTCTWTYLGENTKSWVDPQVRPEKLSFHGHIHGLKWDDENDKILVPKVRRHGNALLVDTGCGCHKDGVLSCAVLPAADSGRIWSDPVRIWNSNGEAYEV